MLNANRQKTTSDKQHGESHWGKPSCKKKPTYHFRVSSAEGFFGPFVGQLGPLTAEELPKRSSAPLKDRFG